MELIIENALRIYLLVCLFLLILYIPRIAYYFSAFRDQPRLINPAKNRLAVLVPAKNESKVIQALLDTLNLQTYDRAFFDVHVIVEDARDPSVAMAKKSHRCDDSRRPRSDAERRSARWSLKKDT